MKLLFSPFSFCASILSFLLLSSFVAAQEAEPVEIVPNVVNGKSLFEAEWTHRGGMDRSRADGLGPLFNANSCVACHNQGGTGGAGDRSTNVQLLSILPQRKKSGKFDLGEEALKQMFAEGKKIHQDLGDTNVIVLHRNGVFDEYQEWREKLIWGDSSKRQRGRREIGLEAEPIFRRVLPSRSDITVQISQRNTPSLFGAGLIESIPVKVINDISWKQKEDDRDDIKGKTAGCGMGRFGWRGQKASVAEFTEQACTVELGLTTLDEVQPKLPDALRRPKGFNVGTGPDMTAQRLADMVEYIRQLPPPLERLPTDEKKLTSVKRGKEVFNHLNCAVCHVKDMGEVKGVYSDFLMHDMGQELADVAGVVSRSDVQTGSIGGYFGPSSTVGRGQIVRVKVGDDSFWQTPPLWGIADTAPYMHDGRAENFHEAILAHGGEAAESKQAYLRLTTKYRRYLFEYMQTLGAPEEVEELEVEGLKEE